MSNQSLFNEHILYRSDKSPEGNEYTWEQLVTVEVVQVTVQAQQLFWFFLFFWLSSHQLLYGNSLN
ncbi:hypothetical protein [Paenibacillus sp. 2RAB27]|uniref:hypothetical protein n=1 Tax=Paenibacillus sp. 2RAB27 TaxID=3232991 RepID=UPI003F95B69B